MLDKIFYTALLMVLGIIGAAYEKLSLGLAMTGTTGPFYCNELKSSGGDDTAVIFVFALFFIPLAVRLVRFRHNVSGIEVGLYYFISAISAGSLLIAALDCGEVFYTAFVIPDWYLIAVIGALPLSAFSLWRIRSPE